ncbi:GNAT family N-acetyltransferase [Jiella sonneratiae]|uniref:GNAT family N-acetyltransferase n=1 Tax=Jiella sonneratiae TaxID=2816856 RepID=A0ABS3J480_9HYPH|nr:GNAT family protein [Jiella sonneratiae]MBO0904482.1 GNAT family N-acetyltransferase [Jiella sonneratiae]
MSQAEACPIVVPAGRPGRVVLEGRYVRLEPIDPARHAADILAAVGGEAAERRHLWLPDHPPADLADMLAWADRAAGSEDPLFHAVIDRLTGRAGGRQALMRITPEHGVVEIGNILWGEGIAGTRIATEALFLAARYVFETLGYRRFEWKCNDRNEPSKRAAERFGFAFEGIFRQHMVVKGENRDTAWFAMLDRDWPRLKAGYEAWLAPENFDAEGRQTQRLRLG